MRSQTVRDPLWNNILLDPLALELVDTPEFQRLRYVRQLGLAYLVYPGATHTRFEHAVGAFHLAGRTVEVLRERGELTGIAADEPTIVTTAALLHDIGHYPFSHALEELGIVSHEEVAGDVLSDGPLAAILKTRLGPGAPARILDLICGRSASPLQRLISGSIDLDKIEYLKRDAFMCGVPYGEIDVDRLIHSLAMVTDPASGRHAVGVREKGLSALESLLFAKYQMYRNVYWHHAVRSATAMYKRLVDDALRSGHLRAGALTRQTDEGLLHELERATPSPLLTALRNRRLYKRVLEIPSAELDAPEGEWIADDRDLVVRAEDRLARELGLAPGGVLLDFPSKAQMIGLDIPMLRRSGTVQHLGPEGWSAAINIPTLANELYRSARWLRVFASERVTLSQDRLTALVRLDRDRARSRMDASAPLLG